MAKDMKNKNRVELEEVGSLIESIAQGDSSQLSSKRSSKKSSLKSESEMISTSVESWCVCNIAVSLPHNKRSDCVER